MNNLFIVAFLFLLTSSTYAKVFNPKGRLKCSTFFMEHGQKYKKLGVFEITPMHKMKKTRHIKLEREDVLVKEVCQQSDNLITCRFKKGWSNYLIVVNLKPLVNVIDAYGVKSYQVFGLIKKSLTRRVQVQCVQ